MNDIRSEEWSVIANPHAGTRQLEKDWTELYRLLKKSKINFSIHLTAYKGHATEIARQLVNNNSRCLMVVGGDGTMNEVVNGIYTSRLTAAQKHAITIALVPYGTGNDWARYWGITRNYRQLARQLFSRKSQSIDIGKIIYQHNGNKQIRYFINAAGIGFDAVVVRTTNRLKEYFTGSSWVYKLALLLSVFFQKSQRVKIIDSGKMIFDKTVFSMAIANGCYSGGGLKQAPDANPTDGIVNLTVIEKPNFFNVIFGLKYLFKGELTKHPIVHTFKGEKFKVEASMPIAVEIDGILINAAPPFTFEIIPDALQILIP